MPDGLAPIGEIGPTGLVLTRAAGEHGLAPFFGELIAGIEEVLSEHGSSLLLHVVSDTDAEMAVHRRWRHALGHSPRSEAHHVSGKSQQSPTSPLVGRKGERQPLP